MNALHDSYRCQCTHPSPKLVMGEDSGLCASCGYIYDERLYEMRLRKYTPNFNGICGHSDDSEATLDDYLRAVDPHYREVVGT